MVAELSPFAASGARPVYGMGWRRMLDGKQSLARALPLSSSLAMALVACATATREAAVRPGGAPVAVRAAGFVDVLTGRVVPDVVLLVRDDRIEAVGSAATVPVPQGARWLDLGERVLVPGLIDAHVHLAWGAGLAHAAEGSGAHPNGADEALATLHAGFTTVRNLGSTDWADLELRDAIRAGRVPGPRVLAAGPGLGVPGGTCEQVFGEEGVVRDPEEARERVRGLVDRGVDVVKLCAGGGVLVTEADEGACELSLETMRAIVTEAHAHGLRVAAHAQGPRAIADAVEAGVDSIEHGSLVDEGAARAMLEAGVALVPTLYRLDWSVESAVARGLPEAARRSLSAGRDRARSNVARAVALGVPIVCGTDASVFPHGLNARELGALVQVGLSPAEALRAATIGAASLLGLQSEIGSIAAGKTADVVAVEGDPLEDITALERVVFVMQRGRVVKDERAPAGARPR